MADDDDDIDVSLTSEERHRLAKVLQEEREVLIAEREILGWKRVLCEDCHGTGVAVYTSGLLGQPSVETTCRRCRGRGVLWLDPMDVVVGVVE